MAGGPDSVGRSDVDRFTTREMVEEIEREIAMRRNVYARAVRGGKMSQADADRRIDLMTAIRRRVLHSDGRN